MKKPNFLLIAFVLTIGLSPLVHAGEPMPKPPVDTSSAELNRIKSLAGRWMTTTSEFGTPNQKVYVDFEVTAGGSAVVEKIFPGTPMEMLSVFYDDDHGKLAMTHYCIMRNRPTLKLVSIDGDTLTMDIAKVEGLKSKDESSMGKMSMQFKDSDHFASTCEGRGPGQAKKPPMTMEFTRVPADTMPDQNATEKRGKINK